MKYQVGDKVYYPTLSALGTIEAVIPQDRKQKPWYAVALQVHGLYSVPEGSLEVFKGQKTVRNLGTKKTSTCTKTSLAASMQKEATLLPRRFKPVPQAGIFCEGDLAELARRYLADISNPKIEKPSKPFRRVTIANATQEEVQDAWHKILIRRRKSAEKKRG